MAVQACSCGCSVLCACTLDPSASAPCTSLFHAAASPGNHLFRHLLGKFASDIMKPGCFSDEQRGNLHNCDIALKHKTMFYKKLTQAAVLGSGLAVDVGVGIGPMVKAELYFYDLFIIF